MRVLVTGASGFVGSHVAEAVAHTGHDVTVGVRESSSPRWLASLDAPRLTLDLAAPERLTAVFRGLDAIVHVAGITRAAREEDYRRVNVEGTRALLEAAVAAGVGSVVLVSSLAARGPDGAAGPSGAYGRSKLEAEAVAAGFAEQTRVVVLRVGGVYGPRDTDLLPLFRLAHHGAIPVPRRGRHLQPVYVTDVASMVVRALERPVGFGPWPVAAPGVYRWGDLPDLFGAALGRRVRGVATPRIVYVAAAATAEALASRRGTAPEFDLRRARDLTDHGYTCDVSATAAAAGWQPRVDLSEGLRLAATWYREQGWLPPPRARRPPMVPPAAEGR